MHVSIGQKVLFHSHFSFHICLVLIPKVEQLVPLCINRQHYLVAFTPLTLLRTLFPCPSIYLSTSLHSDRFILYSLNEITEIGDGMAFGEKHLCYTP